MSAAANDPLPTLEAIIAAAVKEAIDRRMPTLAAVGLVPPRYVLPPIAALLTGYTRRPSSRRSTPAYGVKAGSGSVHPMAAD
jgi:hypothetical protein